MPKNIQTKMVKIWATKVIIPGNLVKIKGTLRVGVNYKSKNVLSVYLRRGCWHTQRKTVILSTRVKKRCTSCFVSSLSLNSVKVKSFQSVSSQSDKTITVQNYKTVFSLHNDARNDALSCHTGTDTMSNNVRRVFANRCFYNSNLSEQALKSVKCLNKRSQVSN